jgi:hypothetical protein
VVVVAEEM